LGLLYSAITAYLGFEVNEGEYKVMGLAAFGEPTFRDAFAQLLQPEANGHFRLSLRYFGSHTGVELGFAPELERLLGPRRPVGKPWNLQDTADVHYANIAATLQCVLEEALLRLAAWAKAQTGASVVCLAGGVALNAVANARLSREAGLTTSTCNRQQATLVVPWGPRCWRVKPTRR
jgi:carbamoyltransferase